MFMNEEWIDVFDYEGLYQISNLGRVKSLPKLNGNRMGKELILKQKTDRYGYKTVCLSKENKHKYPTVHRLVAIAFIKNPNGLPQVNHIDCDKENNNVENLEWVSIKENVQHAWDNGLNENKREKASECHGFKCKLIDVHSGNEITFNSHSKLSEFLGYNRHWLSQKIRESYNYKDMILKKGYEIALEGQG